jgi:hypothetical protein
MSAATSVLEAQTTALLRRLAREQDARMRRIRDAAADQAVDIVRRARSEARARVRQAVLETRREDESALARRRAALDTDARRGRQATLRELLERAWQALPPALAARWQDAAQRERWCVAACDVALRCLRHLERIEVEVDAAAPPDVAATVRQRLGGGPAVALVPRAGLGPGLRLRAGDALVDATIPGLLAARDHVVADLLAEFESRAAPRAAGVPA